jgi:transcriptional regulator of met regulon
MDALAFILFIGWPLSLLIAYSYGGRDRKRRRINNVRGVTNDKTFYEAVNHHVRHPRKLLAESTNISQVLKDCHCKR